jgi:hypothetical protein
MKRILSVLLTLAVAAALVVLPIMSKHDVTAVHAQSGCTDATLMGNYGFTFSGFQRQNGKGRSRSVPFYGGGLGTVDGGGNISSSFSFGLNGVISTNQSYTGTYVVNSDCTGSITATPGSGGDNFALVILGGGAEVLAVDITAGETLTADFKKQ